MIAIFFLFVVVIPEDWGELDFQFQYGACAAEEKIQNSFLNYCITTILK